MTTKADQPSKLLRPSDVPREHHEALMHRLGFYSVPLFFFVAGNTQEPYDNGSGVFVSINDRTFILTARHCVEPPSTAIVIGVRVGPHRYDFRPVFRGCSTPQRGDFGYYEVDPTNVGGITAGNRLILQQDHIEVISASELLEAGDFLALSGYPSRLMLREGEGTSAKQLVYTSVMIDPTHMPEVDSIPQGHDTRREIHVWISKDGNVEVATPEQVEHDMEENKGASGGGWWRTNYSKPAWQSSDARLIGTHIGMKKAKQHDCNGALQRYAGVSLIGNHLALIARDYPTLSDHIFKRWPAVRDYQEGI